MKDKELLNIKVGTTEVILDWHPGKILYFYLDSLNSNNVVSLKLPNNKQGIETAQEIIDALKYWIKLVENTPFL